MQDGSHTLCGSRTDSRLRQRTGAGVGSDTGHIE